MRWWSSDEGRPSGGEASATDWVWDDLHDEERRAAAALMEEAESAEERRRLELEEAYERGRTDGEREGRATSREELGTAARAAHTAAEQARELHEELTRTVHEDVLALAVGVARHLVGRELRADPETFADLVREALAAFPVDQPLRIRVHPEDLSRLSAVSADRGEVIPIAGTREVRWTADASMMPGGCVVEGPDRVLDGRLDLALERVYRRLSDG